MFCNILSVAIAIGIYLFLGYQIRKGTAEQNLATWISWGLLDGVAGASLFAQGGNWYLPSFYVVGCIFIVCHIVGFAKFKWGTVETVCMILVVVSLVLWTRYGAQYATIISTAGVAIATLPQLKDAVIRPRTFPTGVYLAFTIVNTLAVAGGKSWKIEERLYPLVCVILCLLMVVFSTKKYFTKTAATS